MLTLFYASATYMQSRRIKSVCNKVAESLSQKTSIIFYTGKGGLDPLTASSQLCLNRKSAKIASILWANRNCRGCGLSPVQMVSISSWITIPKVPSLIPFEILSENPPKQTTKTKKDSLYIIVETEVFPRFENVDKNIVKIENYGTPIAWKLDSLLAILLHTDISNFTHLLMATFLKNIYFINEQLPLVRIETINYQGTPQPFELLIGDLPTSRTKNSSSETEWKSHLEFLQKINISAEKLDENREIIEELNSTISEKEDSCQTQPKLSPSIVPTTNTDKSSSPEVIQPLTETKLSPTRFELTSSSAASVQIDDTSKSTQDIAKQPIFPTQNISNNTEEKKILKSPKPSSTTLNLSKEDKVETAEIIPPIPTEIKVLQPPAAEKITQRDERPSLLQNNLPKCKPLNVLVYSDVASVKESALGTLKELLAKDAYTIYPLTQKQLEQKYWFENTALIVVCGSIGPNIADIIVDFFLRGGKVFSLCSDILHYILPSYRTAEVREHELVHFSYDKWQKVRMMHHIFCYQASPVKKNFSTDSEDSFQSHTSKSSLVCPRSVELKDLDGAMHGVQVDVLGKEEVWNTPSLLVAKSAKGGRAIFSQIHLEIVPSQFETDELKLSVLKQNDRIRLEIFADLLKKHLRMDINTHSNDYVFQNAYFLGHHESKFDLLQKLSTKYGENVIRTSRLGFQFCCKNDTPLQATNDILPILMHSCPDDFSTVEYFENLKTNYIGRLVIYAPIVSSSMDVISEIEFANGIAVLVRQQTEGVGRSQNQWLSPIGCTMFSIQLHIDLSSNLGGRLPVIQHIIATAMVNAIKKQKLYGNLDIAIKWPNDIYALGFQKIGGLIVKTTLNGNLAIVNIGCGINLDNQKPTVCINELVAKLNKLENTNIPPITYEKFLAWIFNEIEELIENIQRNGFDSFYQLYYKLWLHSNKSVIVQDANDRTFAATIIGLDDFGFLQVRDSKGSIRSLQPDGNSFDMLKGLISPK